MESVSDSRFQMCVRENATWRQNCSEARNRPAEAEQSPVGQSRVGEAEQSIEAYTLQYCSLTT